MIQLVSTGASNQLIGETLSISTKTVESHVRSVYAKLAVTEDPHVHARVRAVRLWLELRGAMSGGACRDAGETDSGFRAPS